MREDLRSELDSRYNISGYGLVGKSSGGYGALVRGMLDDCWDAIACHSGDCGFELLFGIEMGTTLRGIGHHMLMVIGKVQFMKLFRDYAHAKGDDFQIKEFLDRFFASGVIPFSLIRMEMLENLAPDQQFPTNERDH